jgi:F420H(2)-dependent quinone reductase
MNRLLKLLGESGIWKLASRVHVRVFRWTEGRLGGRLAGLPHLLLTTTGRRSGEARTVALVYLADDGRCVIVASNGGSDRPPAWWLNLKKSPHATVEVGRERRAMEAREAVGEERARLWRQLTELNPVYATYETLTERPIPVVVLEPAA